MQVSDLAMVILDDILVERSGKRYLYCPHLTIVRGEHIVISGDALAGKVLLEILAGLIHSSSGSLKFPQADKIVKQKILTEPLYNRSKLISLVNAKPDFRNLSHMPDLYYQQRFNSTDDENSLTVKNYLSDQGSDNTDPRDIEKVIIDFDLVAQQNEELIKLSSGETRRLQLASAVLKKPLMMLLDNPMAGLDQQNRQRLQEILGTMQQSGITLVQTGELTEVPVTANRVLFFEDHQLVKEFIPPYHFEGSSAKNLVEPLISKELFSEYKPCQYDLMVEMKNVTIRYGDRTILNSVNWTVKQGDRWRLKGRNGAGKSTLLSLINGDNPQAFANDIILFDRKKGSGESIWDIKKKTGFFSPELFRYFPREQNCLQVIESGFYDTSGLFRVSDSDKEKLGLAWMQYFKIDQYGRHALSRVPEQVQRLCLLIRALIKMPPLIILDEPCQGLDIPNQQLLLHLIGHICNSTNTTLIYVSHYDHEVPACINKVIYLEAGSILPTNGN